MSTQSQPNVAVSLRAIHAVITRALQISLNYSDQFSSSGFPEGGIKSGFLDYLTSLKTSLRAHHQVEDSILFPALRKVLPDIPYNRLMIEHHTVDSLLDTLKTEIENLSVPVQEQASLKAIGKIIMNLQALWRPHIQIEEYGFNEEALGKLLRTEEHLTLLKSVGEFNQIHALPAELLIPFTIYNLAPHERGIMTGAMPPEVVDHLVPVIWKEIWAPMKPFLLE